MRRMAIPLVLAVPLLSLSNSPPTRAADRRPVVAVFDVECGPRVTLPKPALDGMAEYISSRLTESGRYQVVPRDQLKQRLVQEKTGSYKECFDQSCQIEIGKELAAEKTLATRIVKLGRRCTVSLTFYDLQKSATEVAATQHGGCEEDQVVDSLDKALGKVLGGSSPPAPAAKNALQPPTNTAALEWVHSEPAGIDFTRTEVTVAQYRACMEAGLCTGPRTRTEDMYCNWGWPDRDTHPINCVDWSQATALCAWAGGRLPTEDEWYAEASNKGSRQYPWGNEAATCNTAIWGVGNNTDGCGRDSTWPVCSKPKGNSVSGLCDMAGNVWEWTSSLYSNESSARVLRGGSWARDAAEGLRASNRSRSAPSDVGAAVGLRCVRVSR